MKDAVYIAKSTLLALLLGYCICRLAHEVAPAAFPHEPGALVVSLYHAMTQ